MVVHEIVVPDAPQPAFLKLDRILHGVKSVPWWGAARQII